MATVSRNEVGWAYFFPCNGTNMTVSTNIQMFWAKSKNSETWDIHLTLERQWSIHLDKVFLSTSRRPSFDRPDLAGPPPGRIPSALLRPIRRQTLVVSETRWSLIYDENVHKQEIPLALIRSECDELGTITDEFPYQPIHNQPNP